MLLEKLLKDDRYEAIKVFSRKEIDGLPPKATQFVGDVLDLKKFKEDFTADEVFCCIGTTARKTPDKTRYKAIDFGIPVSAARLSKENDIGTFLVISALGADANSSVFYSRTKGEMEQAVLSENIERTYILQPSIIGGNRNEERIGEKIGLVVLKFLKPLLLGKLKKYRITEAEDIAQAMIDLANSDSTTTIVTSDQITEMNLLTKVSD